MSQTYISILVTLVAPWLPRLGIVVGNEELTTTVVTIISVASAIWGLWRRYSAGGISPLGKRL